MSLFFIISMIVAYLIGSIPTSVWIGKIFYSTDVREFGSYNAGATNTFRVLGKKAGTIVLLLDIIKGIVGTSIVHVLVPNDQFYEWQKIAVGMSTMLGHIFPLYASFRGGKGIATGLGMVVAMSPIAAGICFIIFSICLLLSKYVSLSSIISSLVFPITIIFLLKIDNVTIQVFSICIVIIVLLTHSSNIKRLLNGKENQVNLFGK